jgi:hypothetical protein
VYIYRTPGSCSNACCFGSNSSCHVIGLNGKKCYCDENCLKSGDCCADFANHCYSYLTGACSDRTNNQQCCSRTDNKCYVYGQRNYTTTKTKCFCDESFLFSVLWNTVCLCSLLLCRLYFLSSFALLFLITTFGISKCYFLDKS